MAVFVVRRLLEIKTNYQCPNPEKIQDYFEGRLKKKDKVGYNHLIAHLGVCEKCQGILSNKVTQDGKSNQIEDHLVDRR